ncbi:hypothetical protein TMatcc_007270 [Talaromyces marneffei ATCC 18224]|uniref:SMP-30/Gluconolactonase/LRE-like region domain-containing protein n=1 Tax=Talaromyces marneffei (strain ATCC 18224 / CBS 334.59 / QM 7333) TaxID=441960 RepID=B6QFG4_TALMQ|nr:uncharacterized protein EYB26_004249 [Talaromyces marneffei]EEA24199.1 conserved hypothetical protein [Talaromyces marneffei ATCC 18224]KAE8553291.1 hypothetical protein EYB25_004673 [Talaromyces marneffei]QGA16582.1 hypothetical protein EYB26_004249 [Talaromyces marneffei]
MNTALSLLGAAALPLLALATNTPGFINAEASPFTVFQYPDNGTWIANIANRPNNDLVITRADVPEVWTINVDEGTAHLAVTIPNVHNLIGISSIDDDEYVVIAGTLDTGTLTPVAGSFSAWKVSIESDGKGTASLIAAIPEAQFLHGVVTFQKTRDTVNVLISDATRGAIYKLDTTSAKYTVVIQDAGLAGVSNLRMQNGYLYFTATQNKVFGRVPVDLEEGTANGPIEIILKDQTLVPDGFALAPNGSVAFIATFVQNSIIAVDLGDDAHTTKTIYGGINSTDIAGPTTVQFVQNGPWETLFIATNGGQSAPVGGRFIEPAKIACVYLF